MQSDESKLKPLGYLTHRPQRLRQSAALRDFVRETHLSMNDFILPLFIHHGKDIKHPISSMPGHFQMSVDKLKDEIKEIERLGIKGVILFGIPEKKDPHASASFDTQGVVQNAIQEIKSIAPELYVIADVCCCEYTDHGHCGVIRPSKKVALVDNDATLDILVKQALSFAQVGVDMVAPSGMMDGQIGAIRQYLDQEAFTHLPIMSYSVKYSSSFYGPFRDAAQGAPSFGDRKTYQMDPANSKEALKEAALDIEEGADILMVKPAQSYLDVIYQISTQFNEIPLAAYHVSGEFAAIKAAAQNGWIDEKAAVLEVMMSIKRAGANIILTYFAKDLAHYLHD